VNELENKIFHISNRVLHSHLNKHSRTKHLNFLIFFIVMFSFLPSYGRLNSFGLILL